MGHDMDPKDVMIKYLEGRIGTLQSIIENIKSWVYQRIDEVIPDDILNDTMVFPNFKECTVSLEKLPQKIADQYLSLQNLQKDQEIQGCPNSSTKSKIKVQIRSSTSGEINTVQDASSGFKCPNCDKIFKSRYAFKTHTIAEHQRSQEYHCTFENCGKIFYHHRYLYFHIRQVHDKKFSIERKKNTIIPAATSTSSNIPNIDIDSDIKQEQEFYYEGLNDETTVTQADFNFQESLYHSELDQLVQAEQLIPQVEFSELNFDDQEFEEQVQGLGEDSNDFDFSKFFNQTSEKSVEPLICRFCNKIFKDCRSKRIHEISHERKKEYICDYKDCGKVFYHPRNLYWHKRGTHKVIKVTPTTTSTTTTTTTDFEKEDTTNPDPTPIPIPKVVKEHDVNDDYSKRDDYYTIVEDTSTSIPKKLFKCIYSDCDKQYKDKKSIKIHNAQVHERKNEIRCSYCQKAFYHPRVLDWHIRATHLKTPRNRSSKSKPKPSSTITTTTTQKFKYNITKIPKSEAQICYVCGKNFNKPSYLRKHIKNCHTQKKVLNEDGTEQLPKPKPRKYRNCFKEPVICPICGRQFTLNSSYFTHMQNHKNERKYVCDVCSRGFNNSSHLKYHRVSHFPPSVRCLYDDCKTMFHRNDMMKVHMNTVHSKDTPFDCTICHKKFKIKRQLTIHQNKYGHKDQVV